MQITLGQIVSEESLFGHHLKIQLAILQRVFHACSIKFHNISEPKHIKVLAQKLIVLHTLNYVLAFLHYIYGNTIF